MLYLYLATPLDFESTIVISGPLHQKLSIDDMPINSYTPIPPSRFFCASCTEMPTKFNHSNQPEKTAHLAWR